MFGLPTAASFAQAWADDPRAVWSSFSMIVVSELGDKTFLIAAILAMRQSRLVVFAGAFGALAVMSILSALLGVVFPKLLPKALTTFLAGVLFLVFGARMLQDALAMKGDEVMEEWEEAKKEIEESDPNAMGMTNLEEGRRASSPPPNQASSSSSSSAVPNGHAERKRRSSNAGSGAKSVTDGVRNLASLFLSPVFVQAFVLTFLGEWGDRSQIATIALAAAHDVALVSFGTIVGHGLCTSIAVVCGAWLARKISVKHVTLGGAILFLLFGVIFLFESLRESRAPSDYAPAYAGAYGLGRQGAPAAATTTAGAGAGGDAAASLAAEAHQALDGDLQAMQGIMAPRPKPGAAAAGGPLAANVLEAAKKGALRVRSVILDGR